MKPLVAMSEEDLRQFAEDAATKAVERLAATHVITPRDPWLTVPEAANKLSCSAETIRRKIRTGQLEAKGSGATRKVKL